mgnify:CR=1 FL=1
MARFELGNPTERSVMTASAADRQRFRITAIELFTVLMMLLASHAFTVQAAKAFDCTYSEGFKICIDPPSGSFSVTDPNTGERISGVCGSGAKWSSSWNDTFVHGLYYRICGTRLQGY